MAGQVTGLRGRLGRWMQGAVQAAPAGAASGTASGEAAAVAVAGGVAGSLSFAGRGALVADDSEINRLILRTFLERLGFSVTLAADGREAVEMFRPSHELLCLDISMPELDGLGALREIRARVVGQAGPMPLALAVTVNSLSHQVEEYLAAGFDACLPKPFARAELEALLHSRWT